MRNHIHLLQLQRGQTNHQVHYQQAGRAVLLQSNNQDLSRMNVRNMRLVRWLWFFHEFLQPQWKDGFQSNPRQLIEAKKQMESLDQLKVFLPEDFPGKLHCPLPHGLAAS